MNRKLFEISKSSLIQRDRAKNCHIIRIRRMDALRHTFLDKKVQLYNE